MALARVLSGLPQRFPTAIVIIQHVDERNKGHYTIAQDEATSAVYGMPKAAATLGAAVDILALERIAPRLIDTFSH
jgi:chemotaxis response regulator CheB